MVKLRAVVATTGEDAAGDGFSEKCLKRMAGAETPIPVTLNFGREEVGQVTTLRYHENGELLAEIDLSRLAVVPGIILDPETDMEMGDDGVRTINDYRALSFGLVAEPADPNCRVLDSADRAQAIIEDSLNEPQDDQA